MAKQKDFLKQTVFKDVKVEDIMEKIYENANENNETLDSFIMDSMRLVEEDPQQLPLFVANIKGLVEARIKNNDAFPKMLELVRRANQPTNTNTDEEDDLSSKALESFLKESLKEHKKTTKIAQA
jgi:hypothetical protein